jgi:hypothetical protein
LIGKQVVKTVDTHGHKRLKTEDDESEIEYVDEKWKEKESQEEI